jgi:hypothetical protein
MVSQNVPSRNLYPLELEWDPSAGIEAVTLSRAGSAKATSELVIVEHTRQAEQRSICHPCHSSAQCH